MHTNSPYLATNFQYFQMCCSYSSFQISQIRCSNSNLSYILFNEQGLAISTEFEKRGELLELFPLHPDANRRPPMLKIKGGDG